MEAAGADFDLSQVLGGRVHQAWEPRQRYAQDTTVVEFDPK